MKIWLVTATRKCTAQQFSWRISGVETPEDAISYVKSLGYHLDAFDLAAELLIIESLVAKAVAGA